MSTTTTKTPTRRARTPEARAARRERILDAAETLFAERRFAELHMTRIAAELGLAKGTLYLYFQSKESLFLAVVQRALRAWFADVADRLGRYAFLTPDGLAREVTGSLVERPRLSRLLALLHTVLEENIGEADAIAFKSFLATRLGRLGLELERFLPALEPGEGARLLLHVHALVVGLRQGSDPAPAVEAALGRPELRHLRIDFETELTTALAALFRGFGDTLQAQRSTT